MLKAVWFQIHWFLGITAGLVLAVVGVTGAMLSFEGEILAALNPEVVHVAPQPGGPLAPAALLEKVRANAPGRTVTALNISADPATSARVTLAPLPGGTGGPRGETRYVNPYDGVFLGDLQGQDFFRTTMQIHRWLASGDVGKQIVGASTIGLIILSLSGLYLRWPRRWHDWKSWLPLDLSRRGRNLFWELHSVIGTWVLPFYLLASLTGLYWSYDWYRGALFDITGTPRPQQMGPGGGGQRPPAQPGQAQGGQQAAGQGAPQGAPQAAPSAAQGQPGGAPQGAPGQQAQRGPGGGQGGGQGGGGQGGAARAPLDIAKLWGVFLKESGGYSTATLRLPQGNAQTLTISYQSLDPAHERANNTLVLEASGTVREHKRYDDLPFGQKIMASIFVLHAGSYFGMPGLILMMVASLLMPLFTITGWLLYLDRRKKKKLVRQAVRGLGASAADDAPLLIAFASQSGTAERLAWQSAGALQAGGLPVKVAALSSLGPDAFGAAKRALFVVSTFGEGEPPDQARAFARRMTGAADGLAQLDYGVLALGDRAYGQFCGFGRALDDWLRANGATPLFERIEMDKEDGAALEEWQARLGEIAGKPLNGPLVPPPPQAFEPWTLALRRHLNPGSVGLPTFHLAFTPQVARDWQAGDVLEVRPRNAPAAVAERLTAAGLPADAPVTREGRIETLGAWLTRSILPPELVGTPEAIVQDLLPLPTRDYSIASIPADGRVEILVRQTRTPEGGLGLGSGWLTVHLADGGDVEARLRSNSAFHGPTDDRPLILIGNGTGLAGLRAHLKARIHGGHDRNWLIFGERNRAADFYFRDEISAWHSSGGLARLDFAFSRDQADRIHVQEVVRASAADIAAWVQEGAAIYVCGSLNGMAPAVDHALAEIIGRETLDAMSADRRYCRDVY
ncbi:sulfite reductase flavoprotein subunit alpha [Aquabacter cavernae]|uniref:sulfite reductase flavoprotein subunit alpha n=1 Tax=Aquabacter cavernae TaxID=2496029 RepID=UPI000F8D44AF|nr:sulfite reductase flavoprotein subunit alpha [Aquabacter cavernae]